MLDDKQFKSYRVKFKTPDNIAVSAIDYNCGGYFQAPSDSDSLVVDSLNLDDVEMVVDEYRNPVATPNEHHEDANQQPQPDMPNAALEPKEN